MQAGRPAGIGIALPDALTRSRYDSRNRPHNSRCTCASAVRAISLLSLSPSFFRSAESARELEEIYSGIHPTIESES